MSQVYIKRFLWDGEIATGAAEWGALFYIIGMSIFNWSLSGQLLIIDYIFAITVGAGRQTYRKDDQRKKGKGSSHDASKVIIRAMQQDNNSD